MKKEKIYFENTSNGITVSSSRVVIGEKSFVLRNISAVQVGINSPDRVALIFFGIICFGIAWIGNFVGGSLWTIIAIAALIVGAWIIYTGITDTDQYNVKIDSGGTSNFTLIGCETRELPEKVVDAINKALLEIDKVGDSENNDNANDNDDSANKIKKFKDLLDSGAITQDEFDAKKKELLGL